MTYTIPFSCSASRPPLLLHPARELVRGDAGQLPEHHVRRGGIPHALRQVAQRPHRHHARPHHTHRTQRTGAHGHIGVR